MIEQGCPKCGFEKTKEFQVENCTGWSKSNWINKSNGKIFKLYILNICNDNENFIKIGRTFNTIEKRFGTYSPNKIIPYKYTIISILEGNGDIIYDLENKYKKLLKMYKYIPKLKFKGMQECFKIPEVEKALFPFDNHSSSDVLERLKQL